MASPEVLIVGGGIVGAACARALARSGRRVTLLRHPTPRGEGWRAAAGMLAAQVEAHAEDPMLDLALAGRAFYRRQADALLEQTGIDIDLSQRGILQIITTEPGVADALAKIAWQRQRALAADWLDPDDIRQHFPGIAPGLGGFWAPDDGQLDPVRATEALLADAVRLGVQVVEEIVVGLHHNGRMVLGVRGPGTTYHAPIVVLANGAWVSQLSEVPRPITVAPVQGRILAYPWPKGLHPGVVYGPRCYLLPRNGHLLVGATMEHVGLTPTNQAGPVADLLQRVGTIYPAIQSMIPIETRVGFRPGTPDGRPILGPEPRLPGLWYAAGLGRNGILLAGAVGERIAQGVNDGRWDDTLAAAAPTRFWEWA